MSTDYPKDRTGESPPDHLRVKPGKMTLEIIKQFARCGHTEKQLAFSERIFFIN